MDEAYQSYKTKFVGDFEILNLFDSILKNFNVSRIIENFMYSSKNFVLIFNNLRNCN